MSRLILSGVVPSVNHMYHNVYNKGRVMKIKTKVAERWYQDTINQATNWMLRNKWETASGKIVVKVWFYFPNKRKRDTHNGLKILMDALEDARIYENDQFALPRVMDFELDRDNPRIEIEFEKVS